MRTKRLLARAIAIHALLWCSLASAQSVPLFGYNSNALTSPIWDSAFVERVAELQPDVIRYPGGTVGDAWNWRKGSVDPTRVADGYAYLARAAGETQPTTLEGFRDLLEATGAQPLWSLNLLTATLDDQLELLREASRLGMAIEWVELGNEVYFDAPHYVERFPTPESYGSEAALWAEAIRGEFPEARVAVIGAEASSFQNAPPRVTEWNRRVLSVYPEPDAMALHPYFRLDIGRSETIDGRAFTGLDRQLAFLATEVLADLPDDLPLWITETNAVPPNRHLEAGSWRHGLAALYVALHLLADDRLDLLLMHQLSGRPQFAAVAVTERGVARAAPERTGVGDALRLLAIARNEASATDVATDGAAAGTLPGAVSYPLDDGRASAWWVAPGAWLIVNASDQTLSWQAVDEQVPDLAPRARRALVATDEGVREVPLDDGPTAPVQDLPPSSALVWIPETR